MIAWFRSVIGWFRAMIARGRALWERLQPSLPVRAWRRYGELRGDRLAGAASFFGFVSLFPLLVLSAAIASQVAGRSGVETVQELVNENFPDLGVDVGEFYTNAGALGLVSAVILLYSGLRWVDSIRAAVRSMWGMDDKPGNVVMRKLIDTAALCGLGLLLAASWATSVVVRRMTRQLLEWMGIDGTGAAGVLEATSWLMSVGVNTLLFAYLLAGLPRIVVPVREQALVALVGAVIFEILKTFLVEFVVGPADDNRYATFAAPLAVIIWIYAVTRLLMVLAALTAESAIDHLEEEERAMAQTGEPELAGEAGKGAAATGVAATGVAAGTTTAAANGARGGETPALTPSARQARAVGIAAGAALGAAGAGLVLLAGRAAQTVRLALFSDPERHRR